MRVLVVSCVFPPEPVISSQTSAQIAQALVERGHTVTVITAFPNRPAGQLYPGYTRRLFAREQAQEGFGLLRCFSSLSPKSRLVSRFMENFSFGLTSSVAALLSQRPDVIYSNSWPIFATGLLFIVAKARRIPLVVSVQDIYPESLVLQKRALTKNRLAGWLSRLDGIIARGSRAVIVISDRFADFYRGERRVPPERVHVIPNWGDGRAVRADAEQVTQFRKAMGIPLDARVFAYGGNIGLAAGVETLILAAPYLKEASQFRLLIAGEGSQLSVCQRLARDLDDGRVLFHTPWRSEDTGLLLGLAEVLLLPTRGQQSKVSVPSKLISYWLAGRPVIALAWPQSDLADFMKQSGGGWLVEPDRPDLLAAKIREVMSLSPAELRRRGEAGRGFAARNLIREICLPYLVAVLERAGAK